MASEEIRLSREQLYQLAWSEPMATLAPKYGLSDVGMAKICKKLRVPRPERGYWARKEAGQKVRQTPLPKLPPSTPPEFLEATIHRGVIKDADREEGPGAVQARFEAQPENRIVVAEVLSDPHPLVAQLVKALRGAKSEKGILIPKSPRCLTAKVSLGSADRAACIFDALLKGLDLRGFVTSVKEHNQRTQTVVRVGDEDIEILLEEAVKRTEGRHPQYNWTVYEWVPTGKLALRIDEYWAQRARKSWTDGEKQRVEDCLNAFIVGLVNVAEQTKVHRLEMEERSRQREEEDRLRSLAAKRREEQAARIRALDDAVDKWYGAKTIRSYLEALREAMNASPDNQSPELAEWSKWAAKYADTIDPLLPAPRVPQDPKPPRPEWERTLLS